MHTGRWRHPNQLEAPPQPTAPATLGWGSATPLPFRAAQHRAGDLRLRVAGVRTLSDGLTIPMSVEPHPSQPKAPSQPSQRGRSLTQPHETQQEQAPAPWGGLGRGFGVDGRTFGRAGEGPLVAPLSYLHKKALPPCRHFWRQWRQSHNYLLLCKCCWVISL